MLGYEATTGVSDEETRRRQLAASGGPYGVPQDQPPQAPTPAYFKGMSGASISDGPYGVQEQVEQPRQGQTEGASDPYGIGEPPAIPQFDPIPAEPARPWQSPGHGLLSNIMNSVQAGKYSGRVDEYNRAMAKRQSQEADYSRLRQSWLDKRQTAEDRATIKWREAQAQHLTPPPPVERQLHTPEEIGALNLPPGSELEADTTYGKLRRRVEAQKMPTPAAPKVKASAPTGGGKQPAAGASGAANIFTRGDAEAIADAIERGEQPPNLKGLYRNAGPVRAELGRRGYNMAQAESDWNATQKHLATLNGPQQERLRQAITFTHDSIDQIEQLYDEWKTIAPQTGIRVLNKAALATAKQLPGRAGAVAQGLEAQINDVIAELATVYKGGNSSTDESLKLAAQNLSANWNEETFKKALGLVRQNLRIRQNSITTSQPMGVSEGSPYVTKPTAEPAAAPSAPSGPAKRSQQKFTHMSESGKFGWDGKQWVAVQ